MSLKWPTVHLGEILTERRERPSPEQLCSGEVKIVDKISFDTGRIHYRSDGETRTGMILARPGDLLVSGINAAKGAIAVYPKDSEGPVAATIHYGAYIPHDDKVDIRFLWWLLRSRFFQELLLEYVPGGIKTELKAKRLLPVPIPLPPLSEQRRIVARIEQLSEKIQSAQVLRKQAVEETEAILASARRFYFGGKPNPDWVPLSQFLDKIENGKSPQCESRPASREEWGVLKVGAVSFGTFDESENKVVPVGLPFDKRFEVRTGDFLMNRANTTALVGACAIVGDTRPMLLLSDKIFRFHFRCDIDISRPWLSHAMKSPCLREQIERGASGTSPTMKNISKKKVLALLLPPHSIPEQRRIVAELDALQAQVDMLKKLQAQTAEELDALMPSILDKAFKGQL